MATESAIKLVLYKGIEVLVLAVEFIVFCCFQSVSLNVSVHLNSKASPFFRDDQWPFRTHSRAPSNTHSLRYSETTFLRTAAVTFLKALSSWISNGKARTTLSTMVALARLAVHDIGFKSTVTTSLSICRSASQRSPSSKGTNTTSARRMPSG